MFGGALWAALMLGMRGSEAVGEGEWATEVDAGNGRMERESAAGGDTGREDARSSETGRYGATWGVSGRHGAQEKWAWRRQQQFGPPRAIRLHPDSTEFAGSGATRVGPPDGRSCGAAGVEAEAVTGAHASWSTPPLCPRLSC